MVEPRRFLQVLAGPRQTGKTTLARQILEDFSHPAHYASADEPMLKSPLWLEQQWEVLRARLRSSPSPHSGLLVLDEIQKLPHWAEGVKRLWDEDSMTHLPIQVLLLGSSPLLIQQGLSESLAGRFEVTPVTHWSFAEMREAFGWSLDQYLFFGGYPGSAALIDDESRWKRYLLDSLIETTVGRDILLLTRVDKPALLRRLFELGCAYSGQILSYQKMLGQLQEKGNTTTLAHYLELLHGAGLLAGLAKYAGQKVRQRASSPKLLVLNTALISATSGLSFAEAKSNPDFWGRLAESAVGASLANGLAGKEAKLFYWSSNNHELDFVLSKGSKLTAIEVKSGRVKSSRSGLGEFARRYPVTRKLLVGSQGIPFEEFLLAAPESWVD